MKQAKDLSGSENFFLALQIWTLFLGTAETLLGFLSGEKQGKTPPTEQKEGNLPTTGLDSGEENLNADGWNRVDDPEPWASKSDHVDISKYNKGQGESEEPMVSHDTSTQPGTPSNGKPKRKQRKKGKKPKKNCKESSPVFELDKPIITAVVSERLEHKMKKERQTNKEQDHYEQALPVFDRSLPVGSVSIAVEDDVASTNTEYQIDGTNVIVAAEDLIIGAMDPTDPRASLPVPQQNIIPRDPNHERLSWTACYDDSCPIHLSEKNNTGYYPSRPSESSRHPRSR